MAMDHPDGQAKNSSPARLVDGYKDRLSVLAAVSSSTTLATALGEALASTDVGVTIISNGDLHYSPDATDADANNAKLPTVYTIMGGKTQLDRVRLYSASSQNVSFIVFEVAT